MTRTKRTFYGALLLAAMPLLLHCGDPAEPANRFDFTVNNQSTNSYELYVNNSSGGFSLLGTLGPASSVTYQNLIVGTNYTFRASAPGTGPGTFVHEMAVSSTGPDQTWNITT